MKTIPLLLVLLSTPVLAQGLAQTVRFSGEIRSMPLDSSAQASIQSSSRVHLQKLGGMKVDLVVHYPETVRAEVVSSVVKALRWIPTSGDDGYNEAYTTCRSSLKFETPEFATYELTLTDLTFGAQSKKTGTFGFHSVVRDSERPEVIQNCEAQSKLQSYSAGDLYAGEVEGQLDVPSLDGYYTFSIPLRADASMNFNRSGNNYTLKPVFADPNAIDQVWWMFWQQTYSYRDPHQPYGHTAVGHGTTRAIQIKR